jgi:predicted DCC family thiol-disulfide oxidoreductase YuxK
MPALTPLPEILFYDGHCGLCHYAVKFLVQQDPSGKAFRFAPLEGATFQAMVPAAQRIGLPDSMVVLTHGGLLLTRSDAWVHVLRRLGRKWKLVAALLSVIPRPLRDFGYHIVARTRYLIFGRRNEVCPMIPLPLQTRFNP